MESLDKLETRARRARELANDGTNDWDRYVAVAEDCIDLVARVRELEAQVEAARDALDILKGALK